MSDIAPANSLISAIIVNYNGGPDLSRCIASLRAQEPVREIIVVDNGSKDESLEFLEARPEGIQLLLLDKNLGFAGAANKGAFAASQEVLLFLNPDVVLEPECGRRLALEFDSGASVAGPVLHVEANGQIEYGGRVDWFGFPSPLLLPGQAFYVPGCALATRRELFLRLKGFDARYFMFVEDIDYCWRVLLSGGKIAIANEARARHRGGGSTPGGYGRAHQRPTPSRFRFALRERNSLAMLIKCLPLKSIPFLCTLYVAQSLLTAIFALVLGHGSLAIDILGGLRWNLEQLPRTLAYRRSALRTPRSERHAFSMLQRCSNKLTIVLSSGLPRFVHPNDPVSAKTGVERER